MKTVANLITLQEAQNLKLLLGSAGIDAFIPDEMSAGVAPHLFLSKTGIRLQVHESDVEIATELIRQGFEVEEPDSEIEKDD